MIKKLLNKNNLIIVIFTLCFIMLTLPVIVYADTTLPLSTYLKEVIAAWYVFIKYFCLAIFFIVLIVVILKAAVTGLAEDKARLKSSLIHWIIGLIILLFLESIIYMVISSEQSIVEKLQEVGRDIANDGTATEELEISLYESAKTKAYEIQFTSGMLGLFMYIILIYYTFKFLVIYAKRYINVMILILISPIVILMYTFRRVFQGRGGLIGRWIKEFIYNVFIQVIHAATYSILVGFSLRLSDNALSFLGAILTFIAFFFMFKLDGIIRKIFNFIGGKSTVSVRDYTSLVKHPIESFKDARGYVTETLPQEIKGKAEDLAENLSPNAIKTKAINLAKSLPGEARELMDTIDGKNVKVTAEQIKKEQEKMNNPSMPQKIFNAIQGLALGATQKAIAGVEFIADKTKNQIKKLKEATKGAREELNQDFEIVKRFTRVLKLHVRRKNIEEKAESGEEQPVDDELEATFIKVLTSEAEEALELKIAIKENDNDMALAVYQVYGPSAFISKKTGSTYMGMLILATAKREQKALVQATVSESDKKIIKFPVSQLETQTEEIEDVEELEKSDKIISLEAYKKKKKARKKVYKVGRFNHVAIRTITNSLNRRYILNNEYLLNIYQVGQMVANGDIQVSGSYVPQGAVRVKKHHIKYTVSSQSKQTDTTTVNVTLASPRPSGVREETAEGQTGRIIQFTPIMQRNEQAKSKVKTYHDMVGNAQWAIFAGTAADVRGIGQQSIHQSVQAVREKSAQALALQQLTDVGLAVKLDNDLYVTFSDQSISETIQGLSVEQTREAIYDTAIISFIVDNDIPIEDFDIQDQDTQQALLEDLVQKGIVTYTEASDDNKKQEVMTSLEERKEDIINNKKESYVSSVLKRTAAKTFVKAVDTGDIVVDTTKKVGEIVQDVATEMKTDIKGAVKDVGTKIYDATKDNKIINNKFTRLLGEVTIEGSKVINQVAQEAVKAEAERVKQELISQVQSAVDKTNEYVEAAREMYSISKDDFKRKAEDIDKKAQEFAISVAEKAGYVVEKIADEAVEPFRIFPKEDKDDDEDKDEGLFVFTIVGAVAVPGKYSLKLKTVRNITGKNPHSLKEVEFTIYDAVKAAGGPTTDADLTAITVYDSVPYGAYVVIPKRGIDEDKDSIVQMSKPFVIEEIKKYIQENNISNVETLRKLVHKKTIISRIKRKLKDANISTKYVEELFEIRLKEMKIVRDGLENTSKDMRVVSESDVEVDEDAVEQDRERQVVAAENSQEEIIDRALADFNAKSSSSEETTVETYEIQDESQNALLNQILSQFSDERELLLVSTESKGEEKNVKRLELLDRKPDELMRSVLRKE